MKKKISFVYPTLITEGMRAGGFYLPTIAMNFDGADRDKRHSLVITAGFILKNVGGYYMEVGIYHNGKPLISNPEDKGRMDTMYHQISPSGPKVAIYTMHVNGIVFSSPGAHEVIVKVYPSNGEEITDLPVDEHKCEFYVFHKGDSNEQ
ncbi:hypothetical protein [Dickeya oryzae]